MRTYGVGYIMEIYDAEESVIATPFRKAGWSSPHPRSAGNHRALAFRQEGEAYVDLVLSMPSEPLTKSPGSIR